jgi:hypothetical protein
MSKAKDEIRPEYRREDLGAKAFPTTEAVSEALAGLLALTEQTARITGRSTRTARKRAAGYVRRQASSRPKRSARPC